MTEKEFTAHIVVSTSETIDVEADDKQLAEEVAENKMIENEEKVPDGFSWRVIDVEEK